ncbi:9098_t:CDS:2 [Dentiscutata heterogama]|uniref:9098_t:CDS:1 n=1 Tax=Dentiscutata heterogama TaxID=1316150 RepID=A0ACA9KK89_9GLOM|nr:9098_t:CDS:2 [Dentiscutata heterogama]
MKVIIRLASVNFEIKTLFIDYAPPSQDKKINSYQSKTSNKYEFVESKPDSNEVIPSSKF